MSPKLRKKMKEVKIWINRFQTKHDQNISLICSKLRRANLIHSQLVDKHHITNVVRTEGVVPIPISKVEDFVEVYPANELHYVNAIVQQHLGTSKVLWHLPAAVEGGSTVLEGGQVVVDGGQGAEGGPAVAGVSAASPDPTVASSVAPDASEAPADYDATNGNTASETDVMEES